MKTKHFALTGNIGSGKSTVAKLFQVLNVPIYNTDKQAQKLMYRNKKVKNALREQISKKIYLRNGRLNKLMLAELIFNDPTKLETVNQIVHPAVRKDYMKWREKQKTPYTIQESALTYETKGHKIMDGTIVVHAPEALLIDRVKRRDNVSAKKVMARLKNQMSQDKKIAKSDFLVSNGMADLLMPQVREIHLNIIAKNKK